MAKRRIYIPTFIKDAEYNPSQVRPRLFFWNGLLDCESYFIEGYPTDAGSSIEQHEFSSFPYIDHYSTGSDGVPDQTSDTLLSNLFTIIYGICSDHKVTSHFFKR